MAIITSHVGRFDHIMIIRMWMTAKRCSVFILLSERSLVSKRWFSTTMNGDDVDQRRDMYRTSHTSFQNNYCYERTSERNVGTFSPIFTFSCAILMRSKCFHGVGHRHRLISSWTVKYLCLHISLSHSLPVSSLVRPIWMSRENTHFHRRQQWKRWSKPTLATKCRRIPRKNFSFCFHSLRTLDMIRK